MNSEQQRQHKAVRDELEALVGVAEGLEQRGVEHHTDFTQHAKITTEAFHQVDRRLVDLRMDLDMATVQVGNTQDAFRAFTQRGFWARLNWLVTGR